jgi:adenylate cyclase
MSGGEIQATAVHTALAGFPLRETPGAVAILLILAAAAVPAAAGLVRRRVTALALTAGAAVCLLAGLYLAFLSGDVVPAVAPMITLLLATLGITGARALTGALQRQYVHDVFGRFVPGSVVEEALAKTGNDLRLGGTELNATVLFCDLRGFTQFSETLTPEQVIAVLNEYLSSMSDAILDHGGTLATYMGDGIMAIFGAPVAQPDHADRAVAAAREMVGARLSAFNAWLREGGAEHEFRMGVGINSGPVLSGNVGSQRRLEYTAVGDVTNTASRLEGMTKGTPHQVFVADSTRRRMHSSDPLSLVGDFEVRGRKQPIRVWTLSA